MVSSVLIGVKYSCWQDKASSLVFLDPGQYVKVKLNHVKKRAHLACRGFSLLAESRYSKFLWYVKTRKGCLAPSNQWCHCSRADFVDNNF